MSDRARRPFWIHQFVEYVFGIALLYMGLQDPEPVIPLFVGVLIIVNAALVAGPLGAFRVVSRTAHRRADVVVMVLMVLIAVQPWVPGTMLGRAAVLAMVIPFFFSWFYTNWTVRGSRPRHASRPGTTAGSSGRSNATDSGASAASTDRAGDLGRSAGRLFGKGMRTAKRLTEDGEP